MKSTELLVEMGNLYVKANALDAAIDAYHLALDQDSRIPDVFINLAEAYELQGKIESAIPMYLKGIELSDSPKVKALVYSHLGECQRKLGNFDQAIASFKSAIELAPGNPDLFAGLEAVQHDLENYLGIAVDVRDGVPDFAEKQRATMIIDTGMKPTSIGQEKSDSMLQDLFRFDQAKVDPMFVDGDSIEQLEEIKPEAEQNVRVTLQLTLGMMQWRSGKYEEAENMLHAAIQTARKNNNVYYEALAWHVLAQVNTAMGDAKTAIRAYIRAVNLAPDKIFPWNNVGSLYSSLGQTDEAMTAFHKAIHLNPQDALSWDGLGDIYTRLGRLEDAIAAYQLGNIFDNRVAGDAAITAYKKACDLYKITLSEIDEESTPPELVETIDEVEPQSVLLEPSVAAPAEPSQALENNPLGEMPASGNLGIEEKDETLLAGEELVESEPAVSDVLTTEVDSQAAEAGLEELSPEALEAPASDDLPAAETEEPRLEIGENPGLEEESAAPATAEIENEPVAESAEKTGGSVVENVAVAAEPAAPDDAEEDPQAANLAQTIARYEAVVRENPQSDRAWDNLGNLYRITQRFDEAVRAYEFAVSLTPDKYVYRYQLGTLYAITGKYHKAIEEIQQVLELNPRFVFAHCALASYLRKINRNDEAQGHIAIVMPYMKNEKEYDRACFESIRGNVEGSIDLLSIALEKKQTSLEMIRRDIDLDFIRSDPRYQLLEKNFS